MCLLIDVEEVEVESPTVGKRNPHAEKVERMISELAIASLRRRAGLPHESTTPRRFSWRSRRALDKMRCGCGECLPCHDRALAAKAYSCSILGQGLVACESSESEDNEPMPAAGDERAKCRRHSAPSRLQSCSVM